MTRSHSRLRIRSRTCGEPSCSLLMRRTGTPIRSIAIAVPPVAMISKPTSWSRAASCVAAALSVSVTVMKTAPSRGSTTPAAACALPKAVGKSAAMPITSPVDFISGPRTDLRQRYPDRLRDEGHGARGARVGLDHVEAPLGDRVLDVDQADDAERE